MGEAAGDGRPDQRIRRQERSPVEEERIGKIQTLRKLPLLLAALAGLGLRTAPAQGVPTVFIVGDSTAKNIDRRGWADPFADYFDQTKVAVANRARAGRSSRTFYTEGLWDAVARNLKPGD